VSKQRGSRWTELLNVLKTRVPSASRKADAGKYPFEWFTQPAKGVLVLAQDEAERMEQSYIGTEHLLLGLAREPNGLASRILAGFGVETNGLRTMLSQKPRRRGPIAKIQLIPTSRTRGAVSYTHLTLPTKA